MPNKNKTVQDKLFEEGFWTKKFKNIQEGKFFFHKLLSSHLAILKCVCYTNSNYKGFYIDNRYIVYIRHGSLYF